MQPRESCLPFEVTPRLYRNRPYSPAFDTPQPQPLHDVIYLVEEDLATREEISACFALRHVKLIAFRTAAEYLDHKGRDSAACLVINTHLPDISGFELQARLGEKANPPVIFISDYGDVAATVRAMKAGAIEFLLKPLDLSALALAVDAAFARDRRQRRKNAELTDLACRFATLTPREREVVPLVVGGLLNKQAASVLGISEVTLQIHRSQAMRKMRAESLVELVRMAAKLRIPYWRGNEARQLPGLEDARPYPQPGFLAADRRAVR